MEDGFIPERGQPGLRARMDGEQIGVKWLPCEQSYLLHYLMYVYTKKSFSRSLKFWIFCVL